MCTEPTSYNVQLKQPKSPKVLEILSLFLPTAIEADQESIERCLEMLECSCSGIPSLVQDNNDRGE